MPEVCYSDLRVAPGKFYYGHGCITRLADEVLRFGGKPFILGGPTTVPLVMRFCQASFEKAGIPAETRIHEGACSRHWAQEYADQAKAAGCTVILGIGGGKCLDLAKCTATYGKMDLIAVPTSIATCVASSSVCIMYLDDGRPDGSVQMNKGVDIVIADTDVIATAPRRTLAAGIFDSIAKLPEVLHNLKVDSYLDCPLEKYICMINSQGIYDFLMGEARNVYDNGIASGKMTDMILTNLLHTSVVSGFSCGTNQLALAHGLYDFTRKCFTQEAANILHGEIVALGILMQLNFNEVGATYLNEVRELMQHLGLPVHLPEIGISVTNENIQLLVDYLIPSTGLIPADEPRLRKAIAEIY